MWQPIGVRVMPGETDGPAGDLVRNTALGIVTHNSLPDLVRFFPRVLAIAHELGVGLVVVDNASSDGSVDFLRAQSQMHPFTLCANSRNLGYAAAVNLVFALSDGDDVLLLNPDIELLEPVTVLRLLTVLHAVPDAGVVAPRLLDPDGTTQLSARSFPTLLAMTGRSTAMGRWSVVARAAAHYAMPPADRGVVSVDWVIGAAMLVRRSSFDAAGGWDDGYFLYLEDVDFCLRCRQRGWRTLYAADIPMRHLHHRASHQSKGGLLASRARREHVKSTLRFFARHPRLVLRRSGRSPASEDPLVMPTPRFEEHPPS